MALNATPLGPKVALFVLAAMIVMIVLSIGFCFSQPRESAAGRTPAHAVAQAPAPPSSGAAAAARNR